MSSKDWDPNLTPEQNYVLRQEGTESPGSSPLNNEKEKALIIVLDVELNFLTQQQNMKADQAGLLFMNHYQMFLKKKKICILVIQEQNIIVKNVEVTTDTCSMMGQNQQENDIVIMEFV